MSKYELAHFRKIETDISDKKFTFLEMVPAYILMIGASADGYVGSGVGLYSVIGTAVSISWVYVSSWIEKRKGII